MKLNLLKQFFSLTCFLCINIILKFKNLESIKWACIAYFHLNLIQSPQFKKNTFAFFTFIPYFFINCNSLNSIWLEERENRLRESKLIMNTFLMFYLDTSLPKQIDKINNII